MTAKDTAVQRQDYVVYTVLTGGYEILNEQPVAARSQMRFLCLTDDPELRSVSWEIRVVQPRFPYDLARSQRDLKIRPHLHLPEFAGSLYIDNSVILREPPERLLEAAAGLTSSLCLPRHSYRATVLDEFLEVSRLGLDDDSRIFEQLNHYLLTHPAVLEEQPWWTAILLRDHRCAELQQVLETWYAHVMRYSRRDQLSLNLALSIAGFSADELPLADNYESALHAWPHVQRDRQRVAQRVAQGYMPVAARVHQLEQQLADATVRLQADAALRAKLAALTETEAQLAAQLAAMRRSLSWRMTEPLRRLLQLTTVALRRLSGRS